MNVNSLRTTTKGRYKGQGDKGQERYRGQGTRKVQGTRDKGQGYLITLTLAICTLHLPCHLFLVPCIFTL